MKKNHIRFDWAAKKMLRDKKNFDILEGFLSELLKEDIKIEGFLGSQANQEEIYENFNTVDVYAENAKGEHIIIEIHNTKELDYLMHMLCGNSKAITDYLIVGAPYSEVKKVIAVNIIDFGLGKGDDYIYVGQTEFTGLHSEKQLKLTKTQIELLKKPTLQKTYAEYYLIQTRRFKDVINKPLDEWIYFFKHNEVLEGFKAKGMNAVREKLIVDDLSLEDRKKYHAFLDNLHTEANIAQTVRMEQKEKIKEKVEDALKKQKNDIVNQLMKINMSDDQIIKITGLSEKKLSQTRAKMLSTTKDIEAANEEIQSLNEELKTSKDELQSSNEQLIIINQELLDTQEELNTSHSEKVEARKKTEDSENQQKKLASQLKLATDSAQVGIWSLDIASSKLEWSDLHKKMWGYDEHRQDLTYEDWHKVIVPEDKELAFQRVEESRVNHSKYEVDYRIKRANDGVIVWMKSTGQYYYDAFGVAHTLTGISLDITEQVKARNIIQESKAHLQKERQLLHNFFTQAPAVLAILKGPQHVYEFANPTYIEFVGNREVIGKTVLEALPEIAAQGYIDMLDKVYNTRETFMGTEMSLMLDKDNGKLEQSYMNLTCQAFTDEKGETEGILVFAYDVTEQVKAKTIIQESEARLQKERNLLHDFFTLTPAMLGIVKGPEHVFEFANPTYMEFAGNREMIGKTVVESLPEIPGQGFVELLDNVYNTREAFIGKEIPAMMYKGTGKLEQVYVDVTYQALIDNNDEVEGILAFAYDVTEQVESRKKIEAMREFANKERIIFYNSFMNAPAGIVILQGPDLILEFANTSYEKIIGRKLTLGITVHELFPDVLQQGYFQVLNNVFATGKPFIANERMVLIDTKGDGVLETFYRNLVVQPLHNENGEVERLFIHTTDITEQVNARKQIELSETKFRTLSDTIPNMVWAATPDGQKNFFNKYFLDYTGLPLQKLQGDGIKSIIFPADLEEYLQLWKQSLETAEDFMMEKRMRHHDGTYRWHISHGIAQKDTLDNVIGWIGSNTEIEKQKIFTEELEAKVKERTTELQVSIEQLKQSNSQLDQFAYIVSHDLQEPLRKILTFSMLLKDKQKAALNQEVIAYLTKIESASKRMRTLIEDLLNYSRLLQYEKMFEQTNLNQTLKNIVNDFELLIQEKKGDIKFNELPIIEAIPLQMNQLFYNLIGNALKFSKQDIAPVISITARMLSRKEIEKYPAFNPLMPYVEIIFKDHGIGFDQQYAERIFIIFQRLHGRETFKGTGIGLALCKKITENHHGEIFANAEENEGAAFHVILPLTQSRQTITNKPLKD